ncbi:ribosome biogenesis GTPase Der [Chiayiivirga flava]|uniref:GTPase Der n=1 Tax=Chiayiivirga flava TaxID=659595 RepID=A0A7W8G158_9GAMM|nr:ribosome biogenesis GTPase Der [Chiayiivirga flava]MBB5208523.1 GTP-binding protein [Chiayiivirga flava]
MLPLVALVGRPNVGKSTLFNALTRTRDALVHNQPGVTRDRNYGVCRRIDGRPFVLVDTGGLSGEEDGLAGLTAQQSQAAIDEADLILFVVDAKDGALPQDENILAGLRRTGKPVLLLLNKIDASDEHDARADFARFGFADVLPLSAAHQRGVDTLLEVIERELPAADPADSAQVLEEKDRMRLAIVGRPNVGKSTLVNRLLGEERVITSDVAGTTRDSISIDMERDGRKYRLIDTAGVRRKSKVEDVVEKFSVIKTLQAIDASQVVIVLLDASEGVTDQDAHVLGHVLDAGRALVVGVNKWDDLTPYQREQMKVQLDRRLAFVTFAPQLMISAKHGSGLKELLKAVNVAYRSATRVFSTSELTRALEIAVTSHQPPIVRNAAAKLRFAHPGGSNPPTIIIHGTRVKSLPDSYRRYLENFFRQRFKLVGTPLQLEFRQGENPYADKVNTLTEAQQKKRMRLMRHVKKQQ